MNSESRSPRMPTVPVLFIGGWGRSGSTLLECLLSEMEGVTVLGEVVHLAERGLRRNELCACGEPFLQCAFWREVGERAFAGWQNVSPDRVAHLKNAVDRQRRVIHTARRRLPKRYLHDVAEYSAFFGRIYAAAELVTGARVIVDSSKDLPTAYVVSHHPQIDLRLVHIVRDSRGVAFSWSKTVVRPESPTGDVMTTYSPLRSTAFWVAGNLLPVGLGLRGVKTARLRYEDLVDLPQAAVGRVWDELELPGASDLKMTASHQIELTGTHSVAGNPMRFRRGATTLRADDQWKSEMRRADRIVVTAVSLPMLKWFGYPIWGSWAT